MNIQTSFKQSFHRGAIALCLCAGMTVCFTASAQESSADVVPTREDAVLVSITASIEAIDHETREATLKGPLGNSVTFTVDPQVKRLKEFSVGDAVAADYYVAVAFELREPTAAEKEEPLVILEGAGKASAEEAPAAGGVRRIRAVCTIEGLDRPTETITLKGPLGRYVAVSAADPANLPHLRIGETVVVTYTEALAVSLEKVDSDND